MQKKEIIHQQVFYYLLLIQAFAFPLWKRLTPIIISLMVINWLFEFKYIKNFKKLFTDKKYTNFLLFISIYIFYFLGLIYTSNFTYAWFDLEVKLTFLLIPVLFFTSDLENLTKTKTINILIFFISGCFLSSVISIIHSYLLFTISSNIYCFFYVYASAFHHPSYISMYVVFAILIIAYLTINDMITNKNIQHFFIFLLLWFSGYVIILSSKAGIISLAFSLIIIFVYWIIKKRKYLLSILIIFFFFLIVGVGMREIPIVTNRITTSFQAVSAPKKDVNIADGTIQRMEIWKTSIQIIKENFLFGVGTGDVKDELLDNYEKKGMSFAISNNLNAHGQFFQTFITLGFLGFLVLILIIIIPFVQAILSRNFIYLMFLIIIAFNILVESMFENQAGVVFYAFFNSFLFLTGKQLADKKKKTLKN